MPLDLVMGVPETENQTEQNVDSHVQKMKAYAEKCYEIAREHSGVAAERRKRTYDMKVKKADFKVGDWVWYWYPRRYQKRSPKWQKMYTGPYLVVRFIAPVNYVMQKSVKSKPFVVHTNKIKTCFGTTPMSWLKPDEVDCSPTMENPFQNRQNENSTKPSVIVQNDFASRYQKKCSNAEKSTVQVDENIAEHSREIIERPRRTGHKMPKHFDDFLL